MPLQDRVDPFGDLFADRSRGLFMGNRGGRFHTSRQGLTARRWASRQWICCVLAFKGRQRDVWGRYYTELFFLDEVTALAAGHRPCFECRRREAEQFATLFSGSGPRATADAMDIVLHAERVDGRRKRLRERSIDELPDGAMIARDGHALAVRGKRLWRWTSTGYSAGERRPRSGMVQVLTPPATLRVLGAGYAPHWHPSAVL